MTTPARYRKLNEAAELYLMYRNVTMHMCNTIKKMHSGLRFEGPDTEENKQWRETALAISQAIEEQFHAVLDPYVKRLEEIDESITGKLPKPPGSIILPGEDDIN